MSLNLAQIGPPMSFVSGSGSGISPSILVALANSAAAHNSSLAPNRTRSASIPINAQQTVAKGKTAPAAINILAEFSNLGNHYSPPSGGSSGSSSSGSPPSGSPPTPAARVGNTTKPVVKGTTSRVGQFVLNRPNTAIINKNESGKKQESAKIPEAVLKKQTEVQKIVRAHKERATSVPLSGRGISHCRKGSTSVADAPQMLFSISVADSAEFIKRSAADLWIEGQMKNNSVAKVIKPGSLRSSASNSPRETIAEKNRRLTSELFEDIKKHKNRDILLTDFIKKLPKVDLHCHSGGSIYAESFVKFAIKKGLYFDPKTCYFHSENINGRIPAQKLELPEFIEDYKKFKSAISMEKPSASSTEGHDRFFHKIWDVIGSILRYMTLAERLQIVLKHDLKENIFYKEMMIELYPDAKTLPPQFETLFLQNKWTEALELLKSSKWLENYVTAQTLEINSAGEQVAKELALNVPSITHPDSPTMVAFMLEVERDLSDHLFFAYIAAAMALQKSHSHVVAVNIDSSETSQFAINHFDIQMKMLNFLYEKFDQPNISLHAGEVNAELAPPGEISHHIYDSITVGKARRVGHAASLQYEHDAFKLLRLMKEKQVAVEVCFSSNQNILKISNESHPMNLYLKAGIPPVICSDDPGITRSSLTNEHVLAVNSCNLDYDGLVNTIRNGLEYSFLPGEEQSLYVLNPKTNYLTYAPSFGESFNTLKAKKQRQLEALITKFEATIASQLTLS